METELDYRDVKSLPNWSLNIALSLIHLNEIDLAKEKLVKCLSDHPGLLFPLLEKMQGNITANMKVQKSTCRRYHNQNLPIR